MNDIGHCGYRRRGAGLFWSLELRLNIEQCRRRMTIPSFFSSSSESPGVIATEISASPEQPPDLPNLAPRGSMPGARSRWYSACDNHQGRWTRSSANALRAAYATGRTFWCVCSAAITSPILTYQTKGRHNGREKIGRAHV